MTSQWEPQTHFKVCFARISAGESVRGASLTPQHGLCHKR